MQHTRLLIQLRQLFSEKDCQVVISSLRQDPLVWASLQEPVFSDKLLSRASNQVTQWQPADLALAAQGSELTATDLSSLPLKPLETEIRQKAFLVFENALAQLQPPADLAEAGWLALALRERRRLTNTWMGLWAELTSRGNESPLAYAVIWRTPLSCLFGLVSDPSELLKSLLDPSVKEHASQIRLVLHILLSNPLQVENQVTLLAGLLSTVSPADQLDWLEAIQGMGRTALCQALAKALMQTDQNTAYFSQLPIAPSVIRTPGEGKTLTLGRLFQGDPLLSKESIQKIEILEQLAEFFKFAGANSQAQPILTGAWEAVRRLQARLTGQLAELAEATHDEVTALTAWEQVVQLAPDSAIARARLSACLAKADRRRDAMAILPETSSNPGGAGDLPPAIQMAKASMAASLGDSSQAQAQARQAIQTIQTKNSGAVGLPLAQSAAGVVEVLINLDLAEEAIRVAEAALENCCVDADLFRLLAKAQLKANHITEGIESAYMASILEPSNLDLRRILAEALETGAEDAQAFIERQFIVEHTTPAANPDLLALAASALRTSNLETALAVCEEALVNNPDDGLAHDRLGEVLSELGRREEAVEHFTQATLLVPEQSHPWLSLARTQMETGEPQRSLETLRTASQANPQSVDILQALGEAYLAINCPSEALAPFRAAYSLQTRILPVTTLLAETLFTLGHFQEARQVLDNGRRLWPQAARLAFLRGQTLLNLGEKQAALPDLLDGAQANSGGIESCTLLARTVLELVDITQSKTGDPGETGSLNLANVIAALNQALAAEPTNLETRLLLAEVLKANRQYPEAMEIYLQLSEAEMASESDWYWRTRFGLGQVALALSQADTAIAALQEAAAARPENITIQHTLAEALKKANLADESMQTARFALRMAPHDLANLIWFADLAQSLDFQSDVINVLERAVQIDPTRSDLLLRLGQAELQAGNLPAAHQTLNHLLSYPEVTPQELHQAAHTYIRMEDYPAAAAMLEAACQKASSPSYEMLFDQALIDDQIGNPSGALGVLQQAREIQPEDPRLWVTQADLMARLDRPQAALASLEHALDLAETSLQDPSANLQRFPHLVRKIEADPANIHARLARLQRMMGELPAALEHAERAITLSPDRPEFRSLVVDLAYSLVDADRARSWLDPEALDKMLAEPDFSLHTPAIIDLLAAQAELALEKEDVEMASAAIARAAKVSPNHPRVAAIQSRLAFRAGERLISGQFLTQAMLAQKQNQAAAANTAIEEPVPYKNSREMWAILAIAEAAMDTDQLQAGFTLYKQAMTANPLEPRPFLRFARALVLNAEKEFLFKVLKVTAHTFDDTDCLDTRYSQFQQAITTANQRCSSGEVIHWRNRGEAVFNPSPQSSKNLSRALSGLDDVAALILNYGRINHIAEAKKIGEAYPDSPQVQLQLSVALMKPEPEASLGAARLAVEKNPSNPLSHALLAYLIKDDLVEARQSIETALGYWSDEPEWRQYAAMVCERLDDIPAAISHWQKLTCLRPDYSPYLVSLGGAYLKSGEVAQAVQSLEKAARLDPMQISTWLSLARAYQRAGNLSQALDCADRALNLDSGACDALLLSGQISLLLEKPDLALQRGEAVMKLDPDSTEGILLHAHALSKCGKVGDALAAIEKILPSLKDDFPVQVERAHLVREVRGSQAALPFLQELARTNPDRPEVLVPLAETLADAGQTQAAEAAAQAALQLDPTQASLYLLLGRMERSKGQLDQCIHHLSDAIRLAPAMIDAYIELGRTYQDRREALQALKIYRQANQVAPDDPRAYYQAGLVLKENKDYTGAETMLRQAAKLAPDDVSIRRQLGALIALNLVQHRQEVP